MSDYREKLQSLGFSRSSHRAPRVTVDRDGDLAAKTVEHWDDRVDVTIRSPAPTIRRSDDA